MTSRTPATAAMRVEQDSPADELAPAAEKQSIWKRELSFGRKAENGNAFAEPAVDAEPESVATGVPAGLEHHDGDFEPSADDSIAQAEFEPTAEPVGWWPQSPSAAAAGPSDEGDAPSTDVEYPTFSSWRPAESSHVDNEDDVESDGWQSAQAELAADEGPVDEYEAEADEIAEASETPERDSFWKRERSFGRRKSEEEPQTDEVEVELSWWSRGSDDDQVAADDRAAHADHGGAEVEQDSPADELAPAAEKQSIWKRELSFGRKAENENAFAESAVDAEPTLEPVSFEHHDGDSELNANDSIAQAAVEATAEPVGGWTQSPGAAAARPSEENEAPSSDIELPTLSWQPAEVRTSILRTTSSPTGRNPRRQM